MPAIRFKRGRNGDKVYEWNGDQRHATGRWKCRAEDCGEPAKPPYRYYCGKTHEEAFNAWLHAQAPPDWGTLRDRVLARDKYACVLCGAKPVLKRYKHGGVTLVASPFDGGNGVYLEVDHIKPVALYPDLEFQESNLRTLCRPCHAKHGARPQNPMYRARHHKHQKRLALKGGDP